MLRPTVMTDMVTLAFGLVLGFILGSLSASVFGIPFGLGTSGGVILAGIIIGTIRTYYPLFGGPIPEGAKALMQSIGLDVFIAVLALNDAPEVIDSLREGNDVLMIMIVGSLAAVVPAIGYPVSYALTAMIVLIYGYIIMLLS